MQSELFSGLRNVKRLIRTLRKIIYWEGRGRQIIGENQDFDREGDLSLLHVFFKDTTMIKWTQITISHYHWCWPWLCWLWWWRCWPWWWVVVGLVKAGGQSSEVQQTCSIVQIRVYNRGTTWTCSTQLRTWLQLLEGSLVSALAQAFSGPTFYCNTLLCSLNLLLHLFL